MTKLSLLFCLAFRSAAACAGEIADQFQHSNSGTRDVQTIRWPLPMGDEGITEIGIERSGCIEGCPTYTFIAKGDRTFRCVGEYLVERKGQCTGVVPDRDFARLASFIKASGFMEMKDEYTVQVTDQPTVYVMVVMDGRRKIVSDYGDSGPMALWAIEELVDALRSTAMCH